MWIVKNKLYYKVTVLVILDHSPVYRVTVPYAACVQLYPLEDEHLRLDTCTGI